MSHLTLIGAGIWTTGFGVSKVPGGGLGGAIAMIVGGLVILIGAII